MTKHLKLAIILTILGSFITSTAKADFTSNKKIIWPENQKFTINFETSYSKIIKEEEKARQSGTDFGVDIFFNKYYNLKTTTRLTSIAYEVLHLSRSQINVGIAYDYTKHLLIPIGFNYAIGHWFGKQAYKVFWYEQVSIDVNPNEGDTKWYKVKNNWQMTFGLKINIF